MTKTIKHLAAEVLSIQDASNLGGLVQRFGSVPFDIRTAFAAEHGRPIDTEALNQHPIITVWLVKLCALNGLGIANYDSHLVDGAFRECERLAEGG
jgi:hypothetical protein